MTDFVRVDLLLDNSGRPSAVSIRWERKEESDKRKVAQWNNVWLNAFLEAHEIMLIIWGNPIKTP